MCCCCCCIWVLRARLSRMPANDEEYPSNVAFGQYVGKLVTADNAFITCRVPKCDHNVGVFTWKTFNIFNRIPTEQLNTNQIYLDLIYWKVWHIHACVRTVYNTHIKHEFRSHFRPILYFCLDLFSVLFLTQHARKKVERKKKTIKHFSTSIHNGIHVWRTFYFGFVIACFITSNNSFHWILQSNGYSSMVYFFFPLDECAISLIPISTIENLR